MSMTVGGFRNDEGELNRASVGLPTSFGKLEREGYARVVVCHDVVVDRLIGGVGEEGRRRPVHEASATEPDEGTVSPSEN